MPALLTSTSTAPKVFSAVAIISAISAGLVMSARRIDRLDAELLLDAGALLLDRGLVAEAVDADVGAFLGEGAGDGEPDAGGGAGDDDAVLPLSMADPLAERERGAGLDSHDIAAEHAAIVAAAQYIRHPLGFTRLRVGCV